MCRLEEGHELLEEGVHLPHERVGEVGVLEALILGNHDGFDGFASRAEAQTGCVKTQLAGLEVGGEVPPELHVLEALYSIVEEGCDAERAGHDAEYLRYRCWLGDRRGCVGGLVCVPDGGGRDAVCRSKVSAPGDSRISSICDLQELELSASCSPFTIICVYTFLLMVG